MTYDRETAAAEAWLKQDRINRRNELAHKLIIFAAGIVVGIAIFQKNTYDAARNHPEEAAQALCTRGYEVAEPGIGSIC